MTDEPEIVDDEGRLNEEAFQPWDAPLVREHNRLIDTGRRSEDHMMRALIAAFAVPYLYLLTTSRWFTWAGFAVVAVIFGYSIWSTPRSTRRYWAKGKLSRWQRRDQAEDAAALFELADAAEHGEDRESVGRRLRALLTNPRQPWRWVVLFVSPLVMLTGTWLLFGGNLAPTLLGSMALVGVAAAFRRQFDANVRRRADIVINLLIRSEEQ